MPTKQPGGMRRKSFSPWVRYPSLVLLYGLLVPLAKVMEKTGLWNRLSKRRRREFYGNFGSYQATSHDVFACVYFKSGTNWLMQILVQVIHHGTDGDGKKRLHQSVGEGQRGDAEGSARGSEHVDRHRV